MIQASSGYRAADAATLFDGRRLTLARHLAGWRKTQLADAVGKSPAAVSAWELGSKRPTAATVAELALVLQVAPSFFVARSGGSLGIESRPHFRSLRSTSQVARDQAKAFGELVEEIAGQLEHYVEFPSPDVPSYPVSIDDPINSPELAARHVRSKWAIEEGRISNLIRLCEHHGIIVGFSPMQTVSVDAYSFASPYRPVVVLNPVKQDYYRQRFDLAHELGHLVMHEDAEPGGRLVEEQANRFAAEFLMPSETIRSQLPTSMNRSSWSELSKLKEHWGVSIQALLYRARQLGVLADSSYRNAVTTLTSRGWRRKEPGLINTIETPSLIPRALELISREGISESIILQQSGIPAYLFQIAVSRFPEMFHADESLPSTDAMASTGVVSLLHKIPANGSDNRPGD